MENEEIRAAEEAVKKTSLAELNTRRWLQQTTSATLCTTSARTSLAGFPFGSVVPFSLDEQGHPVIFIANIAAHTANLKADPRACIFVREPGADGDPQNTWRIGVIGRMDKASGDEETMARLRARYLERVPAARTYESTHGFDFWRMTEVKTVRYIAGFGQIAYLPGAAVERRAFAAAEKAPAIAHMNSDHAANLIEMCEGLYKTKPKSAQMVDIDSGGFFIRADARLLYFSFADITDAAGIRHAIIEVLARARSAGD